MWQNVKSIIAFLCIFVYISAAALAGMNIYKAVNEQRFEAQQEIADLTDFASRAGALGFFTEDYIKDVKSQLDISKSIDALIIYGPGDKKIAFEKKSGLISYKNDYPDFTKTLRLYRAPQNLPVMTEGNLNVSISALSPLIDFNTLLSLLRSSLLAILIAVVIAFTTLIVDVSLAGDPAPPADPAHSAHSAQGGRETSVVERDIAPDVIVLSDKTAPDTDKTEAAATPEDEEKVDIDTGEPEAAESVEIESTLPDENAAAAAVSPEIDAPRENQEELFPELPLQNESVVESGTPPETETPPVIETVVREEEGGEPGETGEPAPAEDESAALPDSKGLLATASAMYETDNFDSMDEELEFPDILQGELRRAENAGKDITLLDIEWSVGALSLEALVKQASGFFKQGSRFFEKENGEGIYIIVPDSSLDEIFTEAKEFHKRARAEKHAEFNAELLIGLSTRANRSVDAMNLLNEAERALAKARADIALPIVAFKADPQKYKEFISKKRKTA
jgi:hypothetical protein